MWIWSLAMAAPQDVARVQDMLAHTHAAAEVGCMTGLVEDLRLRWPELASDERAEITRLLAPWKQDLFETPQMIPPPDATDTCGGQQMENRIVSEHFAVEWDEGVIDETKAQNFLNALEQGYTVEVEEMGWPVPNGNDQYLIPAYVVSGNYGGAYTTIESCGSVGYTPYIVAYAGSFSWGTWYQDMAVHEFNHAIQFSYGYSMEFWWWEATATWIQDHVYPNNNEWAGYVTGYSYNPHIAMGASDQQDYDIFYHMYGMSIFARYLEDYHGGPETVRATWEFAADQWGTYNTDAEEFVTGIGLDFQSIYLDFIARNVVMQYTDQYVLPDAETEDNVDSLPADGDSDNNSEPEGYGQNFIRFEAGAGSGTLEVSFSGDSDVAWGLVLAEVDNDEVLRTEQVVLEDGVGSGTISIDDFGEEDVVLIVSPLDTRTTGREYSWTAQIAAPPEDSGAPDSAAVDDGEKPGQAGVCGCSTGSPVGAVGLLSLLLLRRRSPTRT